MTESTAAETFQIPIEAAEAYEASFVPAFFAQWAPPLCAAAGLQAGQRVLDVACGTGIVARTAAELVGAPNVTGVDLNEAMLTVARRVRPDIDYRQGDAASLPFVDRSFDAVLCQMALMLFPDRAAAIAEMGRVCTVGGAIAVAVPGNLAEQPAYGPFVDMAARHAGPEARSLLSSYFSCGDVDELVALFEQAGLRVAGVHSEHGTARFPSVDALVATEIDSTPLATRITPEIHEQVRLGAHQVLAPFTTSDGRLEAPFHTYVLAAHS
jgi:ubiquinone/menaquinone biosynthesis C-methylase UbiE